MICIRAFGHLVPKVSRQHIHTITRHSLEQSRAVLGRKSVHACASHRAFSSTPSLWKQIDDEKDVLQTSTVAASHQASHVSTEGKDMLAVKEAGAVITTVEEVPKHSSGSVDPHVNAIDDASLADEKADREERAVVQPPPPEASQQDTPPTLAIPTVTSEQTEQTTEESSVGESEENEVEIVEDTILIEPGNGLYLKNGLAHISKLQAVIHSYSHEHCEEILRDIFAENEARVLGLDIEWTGSRPPSLLQISKDNVTYLLHLAYFKDIPQALANLLEDRTVLKVGNAVVEDAEKLHAHYGLVTRGLVELYKLPETFGHVHRRIRSLGGMAAALLNTHVSKEKAVSVSQWDSIKLSLKQIEYACQDGWLGYAILMALYKQHGGPGQSIYEFVASNGGLVGIDREPLTQEYFKGFSLPTGSCVFNFDIPTALVKLDFYTLPSALSDSPPEPKVKPEYHATLIRREMRSKKKKVSETDKARRGLNQQLREEEQNLTKKTKEKQKRGREERGTEGAQQKEGKVMVPGREGERGEERETTGSGSYICGDSSSHDPASKHIDYMHYVLGLMDPAAQVVTMPSPTGQNDDYIYVVVNTQDGFIAQGQIHPKAHIALYSAVVSAISNFPPGFRHSSTIKLNEFESLLINYMNYHRPGTEIEVTKDRKSDFRVCVAGILEVTGSTLSQAWAEACIKLGLVTKNRKLIPHQLLVPPPNYKF
eukprot:comp20972_c0_seq2/m.28073 comp20972_c0_seq2/g.28073  ORF comp20972_c0_seq2/g.28073 comp20972_c0_seq2/m.28073 type:complete len:711 (-) comp20972_c0_seq2:85-2217(-)